MDTDLELLWLAAPTIDMDGVRVLLREIEYLRRKASMSHSDFGTRLRAPLIDRVPFNRDVPPRLSLAGHGFQSTGARLNSGAGRQPDT